MCSRDRHHDNRYDESSSAGSSAVSGDNLRQLRFEDGAEVIMDQLASVANAVGDELDNALSELAQKVFLVKYQSADNNLSLVVFRLRSMLLFFGKGVEMTLAKLEQRQDGVEKLTSCCVVPVLLLRRDLGILVYEIVSYRDGDMTDADARR